MCVHNVRRLDPFKRDSPLGNLCSQSSSESRVNGDAVLKVPLGFGKGKGAFESLKEFFKSTRSFTQKRTPAKLTSVMLMDAAAKLRKASLAKCEEKRLRQGKDAKAQ